MTDLVGKPRHLALIALAQVLALSVWFAGAAALPGLQATGALTTFDGAALSSAVQLGFVIGALTSASLGLADRYDARRVFACGAVIAGLMSLTALILPPGGMLMPLSRLIAGAALAFVYPVGMKLAASWARGDTGLLIGLLVGALTLGSASPHLAPLLTENLDWRAPFLLSGIAALASAGLILCVRAGPAFRRAPGFDPRAVKLTFTDPALARVNLGYLGHMWELYAFWAWVGVFVTVWAQDRALSPSFSTSGLTFAIVAIGAAGSLAAGWLADRVGRTLVTSIAMAASGSCALLSAWAWSAPALVMIGLLLIYGVTVIADSAQFSAAAAELAPPDKAGSILTLQTALGFALTLITVQLLPVWAELIGWRFAFWPLALGPAVGVLAMLSLRRRPESRRLANGRR
ncbi:MFS transporter [Oceanicaulis sp. LC35]|uniref:MFS transporter n=1 Tax=Oceanicaulis sp. LC35 TaxID=3349635 RepID=UPI003F83D575